MGDDTTIVVMTALVVMVVNEVDYVISVPHAPGLAKVLKPLHGVPTTEHLSQQIGRPLLFNANSAISVIPGRNTVHLITSQSLAIVPSFSSRYFAVFV